MFTQMLLISSVLTLPLWASPAHAAKAQSPPATQGAGADSTATVMNGSAHDAPRVADDPLRIFRAPLLREGSSLVEAVASLRRDTAHASWVLEVQPVQTTLPTYSLVVLPCTRLTEMERIIESMPGSDVRFQVTGRVFVFRDRNYFLPSHMAVISYAASDLTVSAESQPSSDDVEAGVGELPSPAPATASAEPAATAGGGDSAESIMRELEAQSGPIARSSATGAQPGGGTESPSSVRRGPTTAGAMEPTQGPRQHSAASTLQENSAVVNRRGKIARDRAGGWTLVFDADAAGLGDPPLKLLPCMLLESIEDYARRVGNNSPIIVTGQVYLYNGQNYLLPTVYRIPRESTRITP